MAVETETNNQHVFLGVHSYETVKVLGDYQLWKKDPSKYEKKPTITRAQYLALTTILGNEFKEQIKGSGLSSSIGSVDDADVRLTHQVVKVVEDAEAELIPENKRRPWNPSVTEHVQQVEAYTWVIADAVNERSGAGIDINRIRARAALHDMGRAFTHDAVLHGIAGREILKQLGFAADFRKTTLAHLEAGLGPWIYGITPENWQMVSSNQDLLDQAVADLPLEEVIISLADIGKRGVKLPDGTFVNTISDPVEGLAPSAKRRLTTEKGEPDDRVLMALASQDPKIREHAMQTLREFGAKEADVNKMAAYFGWMAALKRRIEGDYGLEFEGEHGLVTIAQIKFEEMIKDY